MSECNEDGCDKEVESRGWCAMHYTRFLRYGDPHACFAGKRVPKHFKDAATVRAQRYAIERQNTARDWLESHVTYSGDDCLEWPYFKSRKGYGKFGVWENGKTKNHRANRYMCELAHGAPPTPEHQAAHSCGNASCVNPNHLRWATQQENEADKVRHGTAGSCVGGICAPGEQHWAQKLSEDDVHRIRYRLAAGDSRKQIAADFSVSKDAIRDIALRRTWAWLETPEKQKPRQHPS